LFVFYFIKLHMFQSIQRRVITCLVYYKLEKIESSFRVT